MVRLAVYGDQNLWRAVARRLHGASINRILSPTDPPPAATDFDALLIAEETVDTTVVKSALTAGRNVLCSADIRMNRELTQSLAAASRQSGAQFAIINPDRHLPSRDLIRQQLDAAKLGVPGLIRSHCWEAFSSTQTPVENSLPTPLLRQLDLTIWYAGRLPNTLFATELMPHPDTPPGCRIIQVHLGFTDGGMALIDYSNQLPPGDNYQSLSIIASSGAAYADDHQNSQLFYQGRQPHAVRVGEEIRQWANLTQEFANALEHGVDLSSSHSQWLQVLDVADGIGESLTSRQAIVREGR